MVKKVLLFVLFLGLVAAGIIGYLYNKHFVVSNIMVNNQNSFLFIPKGATAESVLSLIKEQGYTKDINSLEWLMDKKNYRSTKIVPGNYKIQDGWTNNQLINHLRAGNGRLDAKVQFANVRTLRNLSDEMSKEIELTSDEIYNWLTSDKVVSYGFTKETIISMFLPNTYQVDFDITVEQLMKRMAKEYKKFWGPSRLSKLQHCKLTQSECATLASIVFSETNAKKDMRRIAGVYMNRLRIGMPLQADPTLIFALNDYSIKRVLNKHMEVESPYNTYKYSGLPPGPINIPPLSYLDSVLDYEKHKYLYFVAKEDFSGESYFATNLRQHMIYARKYQNALNRQKRK